ncbi:MAG: hypothetical protein H2035_04345 [Acidimicrobiales bacterium]|nr:hypothetical protein [Acidimicrobiales bacterium]
MENNEDTAADSRTPLIESQLNEYEVEFSKVESTLSALADGIDPTAAASWISKI